MRVIGEGVRGVTRIAPSVLRAYVCDQRLRTLALDLERCDERVFRIYKDVIHLSLQLQPDRELHRHLLFDTRDRFARPSIAAELVRDGEAADVRSSTVGDTPRIPLRAQL
jgi:hypothetical protein